MLDSTKNSVESLKECDIFLKTTSNRGQDDVQAKNVAEKSALLISRPNSSENNSVQNTGKVNSFEEAKKGRKGFNTLCAGMEILAWFLVEGKYYSHT